MKHFFFAFALVFSTGFSFFTFAAQPQQHQGPPADGHLAWTRNNTHARLFWEKRPQVGIESVLRIEMMDGNIHQPTNIEADVAVQLWMPSMGHGSSPVQLDRIANAKGNFDTAVYRVSKMNFIMEGEWEVRVTLTYADGTSEMKSWKVVPQ